MAGIIHDDRVKLNFSHRPLIRGSASGCALANNLSEQHVPKVGVVVHTTRNKIGCSRSTTTTLDEIPPAFEVRSSFKVSDSRLGH